MSRLQAEGIFIREPLDARRRCLDIVDQRDTIGSDDPMDLLPIDLPGKVGQRKHDARLNRRRKAETGGIDLFRVARKKTLQNIGQATVLGTRVVRLA